MTSDNPLDPLIGRRAERATLHELAASVRIGVSRVLLLTGDAGIGKTAVLNDLAEADHGLAVLRLTGAEAESHLPYAAIQRLTLLRAQLVDNLPGPQRSALRVAIGLESGAPPDRFLVGLAVHSMLSAAALDRPMLVIVDDLHWLDQESIDALAFAARRLGTDGVGIVLGQRADTPVPPFDGFPRLNLLGLPHQDAMSLLRRVVTRRLEARISDQIVTATGGNPLAIIDLAQELSTHQLVGLTLLPEPLPIGSHLQAHYLRQTRAQPPDVQTWLLLAATDPLGDPAVVAAASAVLGIAVQAQDLAEAEDLVRVGRRITFRHPLVRSAIYAGATSGQRRRVHNALAAVTRADRDADRRAWHLAAACVGPSEEVALLLGKAAERAAERGGYSGRASFLARAVELTPEGPTKVQRTLLAAEAALMAGRPVQTLALLAELDPGGLDDMSRGRRLMIQASAQAFSGAQGAMAAVPAICQAAATAFEGSAPTLARDALLTAFERSLAAEWMMTGTSLAELAEHAERVTSADSRALPDLVLRAITGLIRRPFVDAFPGLRAAIDALREPDLPADEILRFGWVSVVLTTATWDDEARTGMLTRAAEIARGTGALHTLDALLYILSVCETVYGQLDSAAEYLAELQRVRDSLGMSPAQQEMFRNIEYLAWRGDDGTLARSIESSAQAAMYLGLGGAETMARTALMITQCCSGDYESAYHIARRNHDLNFMQISIRVLPDLIESAARSGRTDEAREALAELTEIATASGTPWGLGVLERSAAILSEQDDPESHYLAAISHLSPTRARSDLARSHLLYGEWLRRHKRRRDARVQLGSALDHFEGMGAADWAARARREVAATGAELDPAHWQAGHLTPQEAAVGRLAAGGATNAEIAAALVLSPHTVDYHLRKVYRKLGINSRRDLGRIMASIDG